MRLNRFWISIIIVSAVLSFGYLTRSFLTYLKLPPYRHAVDPIDITRRWREVHYVARHRNPYDVAFAHANELQAAQPAGQRFVKRSSDIEPDLGVPSGIVYPPWAFPGEFIFYWPSRAWHIYYYAIWMALGIAGAGGWGAYEMSKAGGSRVAVLAAGISVLACAAWGGAVIVGNNPPVVVGSLIVCYVLLQLRWDAVAGLALGLALLKPTVAGPFLIPLLLTRRWTTVITALLFIGVESAITWSLTSTDPIEMLRQMLIASRPYADQGFGPAQYLMHAGIASTVADAVIAVLVLTLACIGFFKLRTSSLAAQFALAAVAARLWSYHLYYDDAILVFTLIYFACALQRRQLRADLIVFVLLLISLWMPGRFGEKITVVQIFHLSTWVIAGAAVVVLESSRAKSVSSHSTPFNGDAKGAFVSP